MALQIELTDLQIHLPRNSFSSEVYTLRSRRARLLLPVSAAQLEAMRPCMDRCLHAPTAPLAAIDGSTVYSKQPCCVLSACQVLARACL